MSSIETMIKTVINKTLLEDFPQIQIPAIVKARVTRVLELAEYEQDGIKIENKDEGSLFEARIIKKWYEYNLKILTKEGEPDIKFPEIPGIKSKLKAQPGAVLVVAMLYGELNPCILAEVG